MGFFNIDLNPFDNNDKNKINKKNNFNNKRNNNDLDDIIGGLGKTLGTTLGSALGSAIGQAVQPAVNNIGNSVATSIKENAGTATKSMVSIAESQKKIANKKETVSYEFYEVCPVCAAPKNPNGNECEYCGASLIKNSLTKIE